MSIVPSNSRRKINDAPSPVTIPEEIIAEILSMINVKTLMRFKSVSKSWNSIISDPFFVKLHLDKSSQIPHFALFSPYFSSDYASIQTVLNHFPLHRLLENEAITTVADDQRIVKDWEWVDVGSCNGLICLIGETSDDEYREFYLCFWNPATNSVSEKLGTIRISLEDTDYYVRFSFGYDNLSQKYKVVAFSPYFENVIVFTLGDNDWRNIQSFPTDPFICNSNCLNSGVYLNNSLNWLAIRKYDPSREYRSKDLNVEQFVIISLDLGTETYTQLLFPRDFNEVPPVAPIVCILMECLCFSHYSKACDFVIWQMKEFGVQESWTKLLKFNYRNLRRVIRNGLLGDCHWLPLHVFENGDTLILTTNNGQVLRYNRRNHSVEQTAFTNKISWGFAKHYVESLVSTS